MISKNRVYLIGLYSIFFSILIGINFLVSYVVKTYDMFHISNKLPFNLPISSTTLWIILLFVTYAVFQFNIFKAAPISAIVLLSGAWSNFFERIITGSVADYLVVESLYFNLADIQIWLGLVLINLTLWGFINERTFKQRL